MSDLSGMFDRSDATDESDLPSDPAPHIPVMLMECVDGLKISPGGIYFDGTVGYGGHCSEILKRCMPGGKVIACDLDDEAVAYTSKRFASYGNAFHVFKSNFKDFEGVLDEEGIDLLDGAILDLGLSSLQIDKADRGFSYLCKDAPLDMRMDTSQSFTAETLLNEFTEEELTRVLKEYGEETFARQIARNVVKFRNVQPLKTCGQFADVIENSIPYKFRQNGPCSRKSFQAVRIAVNKEIDGLYESVLSLSRRLRKGGRIAILTFHSLEDRAVKNAFKMLETDCTCDKSLPVCVCGKVKEIEIITKKPIMADEDEIKTNSRSKSAKLRIAERT